MNWLAENREHGYIDYGIVPGTGVTGLDWPASGAIPQSYSAGGWTYGNEGFVQQSFLGASIRNFSVNGGFGDSTSSLSVSVVNDEYNLSDTTGFGKGDDPYHNGIRDNFMPPPVGSPVFFKFGKCHATVEQAWRKTFDVTYKIRTLPPEPNAITAGSSGPIENIPFDKAYFSGSDDPIDPDTPSLGNLNVGGVTSAATNKWVDLSPFFDSSYAGRGRHHFPFGGILQSYTENRGTGGDPLYEIQVMDPREILTNATMILNNYAGTTFENNNLFNIYGFLEYDPTDATVAALEAEYAIASPLTKSVAADGSISYAGDDMRRHPLPLPPFAFSSTMYPPTFPITGRGYSRRSDNGIPLYRVLQGMDSLFQYSGTLFPEYKARGFGGAINFRGFKYIVDFSGIPLEKVPKFYYLDFDQIDLLAFAQELCDIISHDLFVSLLPVIDHPSIPWVYSWNKHCITDPSGDPKEMIAGIIRIDAIDRSDKPEYGSIAAYLHTLAVRGVEIENRDVGFELSNIETDKFIVGAQETELYAFSNNKDRDLLEVRKHKAGIDNRVDAMLGDQWYLSTSLNQQILPFYGFLGKDAVTIPRGFGSYQQILLDATSLNAHGVGNYYVATELELRAASISYQRWADFLNSYNNYYMKSIEPNDALEASLLQGAVDAAPPGMEFDGNISNNYAVACPRCVFRSDKNFMGNDGLPASPCNPPYGYPLYYKRAMKIGIPEAGAAHVQGATIRLMNNLQKLKSKKTRDKYMKIELAGPLADAQKEIDQKAKWWAAARNAVIDFLHDKESNTGGAENIRLKAKARKIEEMAAGQAMDARSQKISARLTAQYDAQVGLVEDILDNNMDMVRYAQNTDEGLFADVVENATKVYSFIKSIADKHLGKTFLVKIPKRTNLSWKKQVVMQQSNQGLTGVVGGSPMPIGISPAESGQIVSNNEFLAAARASRLSEVKYGPFGFKPQPINPELGYSAGNVFQTYLSVLRDGEEATQISNGLTWLQQNALSANVTDWKYTHGALKCHYNPLIDNYEYNYTPEPQGGYHPFELYQNHVSPAEMPTINRSRLPLGVKQLLIPYDLTNFISNNGRVSAYARYDNSQFLNFHGVSKDSITQEKVGMNGVMVPDIVGEMDNMKEDKFHSFHTTDRLSREPKVVAFVKCEIDAKLYMPPATIGVDPDKTMLLTGDSTFKDTVFGRDVIDIGQYSKPRQIWVASGCYWDNSYTYFKSEFVPNPENGGRDGTEVKQEDFFRVYNSVLGGDIIQTDMINLDSDHVYALVTMPGRISPTIDARYMDGPHSKFQPVHMKQLLTMDTVKGVLGLEKPTVQGQPTNILADKCSSFDLEDIIAAFHAQKLKIKYLNNANPEKKIGVISPSPVYPDIVVLPLTSSERCYGPWISSSLDIQAAAHKNIGGKITFEKDEGLAPWNYAGYQLMHAAGSLKAQFSNSLLLFSERGGFVFPDSPRGNSLAKALVDGGPLVTSISVNVDGGGVRTTYKMDLYTAKFGKMAKQKEILIGQISRERQKMRDERNALLRKGIGKGQSSINLGAVYSRYNNIGAAEAQSSEFLTPLERKQTVDELIVASTNSISRKGHNDDGTKNKLEVIGHEVTSQSSEILKQTLGMYGDDDDLRAAYYNSAGGTMGNMLSPASEDVYHPEMAYFGYNHFAAKQARFYYQDFDEDRPIMNVGSGPESLGGGSAGGSDGSRSSGGSSYGGGGGSNSYGGGATGGGGGADTDPGADGVFPGGGGLDSDGGDDDGGDPGGGDTDPGGGGTGGGGFGDGVGEGTGGGDGSSGPSY
jgi:hypothetical protein